MSDTIKFNVSGFKYQEPRSILRDPHSRLSQIVSEQTSLNSDAEVYVNRDGALFHYVMDYVKYGRVVLPVTESRNTLMNELVFFGILFSEDDIVTSGKESYTRTSSKIEDDAATPLKTA